MKLTPDLKEEIDQKTYQELLRHWRFADTGGNEVFQGESGDYYSDRMAQLRREGVDHVGASKRIGWELHKET